jgi:signal transduction histidine kinase
MTREVERDKQIIKSYNQSLNIISNNNKLSYIRIDLETQDVLFLRIKNKVQDSTNFKYTDKFLCEQKKYFIYDFEFDEYFNQLSFKQLDKAFNKKKKIELEYSIRKDNKFYEYSIKVDYSLNPFTNHREAILSSTDITDIRRAKDTIINFSEKEYDFIAVISMYVDFVNVFYQNKKEIDFSSITLNPTLSNFIDTMFSKIKAKKPDIHFLRSIINNVLKTHKPDYLLIETESGKFKNITITTLDDKKKSVIMVCKDLTEINKKEMEIQRALKKLAEDAQLANKNNTDLLANISHDMRTPLTAIMGLSNLGIENTCDEKEKEYFRNIASSSRYLSLLLNDVIELQKIESGDFVLNPTQIYTPHFQSKILAIISPKLKEKNINFKIIGENKGPYYIYNDEDRLIKVLTNLITNAIKYTNVNGNITWRYKYLKKPKFHMQHIITDDGIGMSSDFQQIMAKKFTKDKNFPDDTISSSGLGLTVVNSLLHHMGGDIMCKSDLDLGTTFTVNIPLKVSSQEQYELQNNLKTYINRCALYDKDILICEDNDISVMIIKKHLEQYKINVDVACNGSQAVKMIYSKNYDAILMDIIMPVMNGIEATTRIRKTNKDIPIIALSSVSDKSDINNSITCGMNAHIIKPIDKDILFDTLATYIK